MKLKSLAAITVLAATVAISARLAFAFLNGIVVNNSYAVSQIVPIKLGAGGVSNLSTTVFYSTPSFSNATFTTGQVSTGSITIANNALLSTSAATESIVIKSTSGVVGDFVTMSYPTAPGAAVVRVNRDWVYGPNTSSAAINLAAALRRYSAPLGGVSFVASGNVVYATAPVGSLYNGIHVVTNDATTITVSSPTFLGGRNANVVSVNGTLFQANLAYSVGVSSAASATNLAAAINARASLNKWVTATAGSGLTAGIVSLRSKLAGSIYNFSMTTSNSAAASVFAANMYGGLTPSWVLGGTSISVPAHGLVTGLPVLYSAGSSPAISGLTDQTTYYIGAVDANDLALATSNSNAAAGTYVTLASSSSLTAASTYLLSPLAFSIGHTGFFWEVSNDGSNWTPLNVSSLTYTSAGSRIWTFGAMPFAFLGMNVTVPSAGAFKLKVNAQGN